MKIETYDLPDFWASALINGDTSGLDESDLRALDAFENDMIAREGSCRCIDVGSDEGGDFRRIHDASQFGVLACNVLPFTFDVTKH